MRILASEATWERMIAYPLFCVAAAVLTAAGLAGCNIALRVASPAPDTLLPGTYEVSFCAQDCGSGQAAPAVVSGIMVLEELPLPRTSMSDSAWAYYQQYTAILYFADAQETPTACFAFVRRDPRAGTYAGLEETGLSRWTVDPDSAEVRIVLYHSPDASYVARLTPAPDGFRGRGNSSGGGVPRGSIPDDSIRGRRIGPPDPSICSRAAESAAAELRARSRRSRS
jgi:hypothetical protein